MTAAALRRPGSRSLPPALVGVATLAAALLVVELLIQLNFISRFIVPPPSEIIASFGRVIVEEHVIRRFFLTLGECLTAGVMLTVFGIAGGVLMHRIKLLQQACETWVAAMAIFVGVRLGLIFALINIVGVEFLINYGGLGQLINDLAERYDLPGTYAAICFVILVSVLFFMALEKAERWLRPID
jgi:ABC-type nitrate/sulfonate/bicarbonate transport system permease component